MMATIASASSGRFGRVVKRLRHMGGRAAALELPQTGASLAFLSLLAIVPIISVAFAVLSVLPDFAHWRGELQRFMAGNLFPAAFSNTVSSYLQQFADRAGELSLVATLVFFATALSMLFTIDRSLNRIWATPRPRSFGQRLVLYWAALTIAPLLLGASLAVNGMIVSEWLHGGALREVRTLWLTTLRWIISGAALTLLYRLVPNTSVRWRDALWGAIAAAVVLELLRRGFGMYLERLPTYTIVYGAFAALPMFLLWLFLFWTAVLIGAVVASRGLLAPLGEDAGQVNAPGGQFLDAARVLAELARLAPGANGDGLPAGHWRQVFEDDQQRALATIQLLADNGYVVRMIIFGLDGIHSDEPGGIWDEHWALARPAGELRVRELFDATWGAASVVAGLNELDQPLGAWANGPALTLGA